MSYKTLPCVQKVLWILHYNLQPNNEFNLHEQIDIYRTFVGFKVTNLNNSDAFDSWDIGKLVWTEFNNERKPTDPVLDTYNLIRTN